MGPSVSPPHDDDDDVAALLAEAGWVRKLARRLAYDQAEADDLAQGALALALQKRPAVDDGLRPWLGRVVRRLAKHRVRADQRRGARETYASEEAATTSPGADELFVRLEAQERLSAAVRALPAPYAEVLLRRYYDGQTPEDIGRAMGASAATTRSRLARGLEALRQRLVDESDSSQSRLLSFLALAAGSDGGLIPHAATELVTMKASTKAVSLGAAALVGLAGLAAIAALGPESPNVEGSTAAEARASLVAIPQAPGAQTVVDAAPAKADDRVAQRVTELAVPKEETGAGVQAETAAAVTVVRARVVDSIGEAVEGAVLRSIYADGRHRGSGAWDAADATGAARLELEDKDLRAWKSDVFPMTFSASHPGHATRFALSAPEFHGESDLGLIQLPPGGAARGTVVDEEGAPIAGVLIYADHPVIAGDIEALRVTGPDRSIPRPRSESNALGQFECMGIEAGQARLWAYARGNLWTLTDTIEVTQGATVDAGRIMLQRVPAELTIAGIVLTADGAPCAGATVHYKTRYDEHKTTAEADGTFRIFLVEQAPVVLVAQAPDSMHGLSAVKEATPGTEVELHLAPAWNLSVAVVDSQARPIEGASVLPLMSDERTTPGFDWETTGADGRVGLRLPLEPTLLRVGKTGFEYATAGPFEPGSSPSEVSVTMAKKPTIQGRVVHNGQPVQGAKVEIARRQDGIFTMQQGFTMRLFFGGRSSEFYSGEDGRFEYPVDPEWTSVSLVATSQGLATGEIALELEPRQGAADVIIEMTGGGSIIGNLLAPPGVAPEQLVIAASRGDCKPVWTRPNADGSYELRGLTPGPWRVEGRDQEPVIEMFAVANDPEDQDFKWNAEVVDGEATQHDVDMRQLGDVRVHGSLRIDGVPAAHWRVTALAPVFADTKRVTTATTTDESGQFVLVTQSGRCDLQLEGTLPGGASVKFLSETRLSGTRVDWEHNLTTGPLNEAIDDAIDEVRLVSGSAYKGDRTFTSLPITQPGRAEAQIPAGKSSLQKRDPDSPHPDAWSHIQWVVIQ